MREIKFRALDNMGKWQYGYYQFIKHSPVNGKEINQHTIHNGSYAEIIKPKTVGQLTGLKDKNGKEIWEGDIVKDPDGNFKVEFSEYEVNDVFDCGVQLVLGWHYGSNNLSSDFVYLVEVIGNIYKNKNLLTN